MSFLRKPFVQMALVALLGVVAYSNTLDVPFQWDEQKFIVENEAIRDLDYFLDPSSASGLEQYRVIKSRYVGYLTFALNYRLNGYDVRGYHAVNIAIHLLNASLLYLLVLLTFRTPFLREAPLAGRSGAVAFLCSALFVAHPVQTEAVTYIFQRLASLAAMFYLLSVTAYAGSRLAGGKPARWGLYALSFLSAVLAMKTKENAFTLPVVIAIYELLFFEGPRLARALRLAPLALTMLLVPLSLAGADGPPGVAGEVVSAARGYTGYGRGEYLFTQFRVLVTYVRLLFVPVNQNIDYDYPVFRTFFDAPVMLSFLFLSSVFAAGIYLAVRSRHARALRLVALGIFWFFITISVESSIVPLQMLIDEYRVYLPSAGVFMAMSAAAVLVLEGIGARAVRASVVLLLVALPVVLAVGAFQRNRVWQSEITLWEDVVRKSPLKSRGHYNLGRSYRRAGFADKAVAEYRTAIRLNPGDPAPHFNLGVLYIEKGLMDKAREEFETTVRLDPGHPQARKFMQFVEASRKAAKPRQRPRR